GHRDHPAPLGPVLDVSQLPRPDELVDGGLLDAEEACGILPGQSRRLNRRDGRRGPTLQRGGDAFQGRGYPRKESVQGRSLTFALCHIPLPGHRERLLLAVALYQLREVALRGLQRARSRATVPPRNV